MILIIMNILIILLSIGLAIGISVFFQDDYKNLVQLIVLFCEILTYFILLKKFNSMNELVKYHGAEHKAVNAYEKCKNINELTLENIKKSSRIHKKCGGNLVMYVILFMFLYILLPIDNLVINGITNNKKIIKI